MTDLDFRIQQLRIEIENLRAELARLRAENAEMKARLRDQGKQPKPEQREYRYDGEGTG